MSEVQELFAHLKTRLQFIKFLMVGLLGFFVALGVTLFLTEIGHQWYVLSFVIGLIISWLVTFVFDFIFTFEQQTLHKIARRLSIFLLIYIFYGSVNAGMAYVLTDFAHLPYQASIMISLAVAVYPKFKTVKWLVFNEKTPQDAGS